MNAKKHQMDQNIKRDNIPTVQNYFCLQLADVRISGQHETSDEKSKYADERVEPRFFGFYWYTSTVFTTATSYSSTATFTAKGCTPSGFTYSLCG